MDRHTLLGAFTFAFLTVVLALALQVGLELAGLSSQWAASGAMYLGAIPFALLAARRVGRVTHLALLVVSAGLAVLALATIVLTLNAVTAPTGGHFGWPDLLNALNWRNSVFGSLATLAAPQLWLLLFNRMAANNSSKPTPLRGAA